MASIQNYDARLEGKLVKGDKPNEDTVYLVLEQKLRPISSMEILKHMFGETPNVEIDHQGYIDIYPRGPAFTHNPSLVSHGPAIWLIDDGKKRSIDNMDVFNRYKFAAANVKWIGSVEQFIPVGTNVKMPASA